VYICAGDYICVVFGDTIDNIRRGHGEIDLFSSYTEALVREVKWTSASSVDDIMVRKYV
jgi:hypothetical protein